MASYTKLSSTIINSTVWQEGLATKVVWITMLALADKHGEVMASVPGLARAAGVSLEECLAALQTFSSPDKYSRTQECEGRRIDVIDGGWWLINHAKHRALASKEESQEAGRERARRQRTRNASVRPSTPEYASVTPDRDIAEAGSREQRADPNPTVSSSPAAASPVPSTIARATEPQPQQSPEKEQEGSPIPEKTPSIQSRAAEKLRDPTSANWDRPASWPELVTTADAFAAALGLRMPRLGGMSDAGVRALLELFAAGFTTDELSTAAKAAKTDPWCQNSTAKRGLSSMSPEVVRRLLDVRVRVEAPDAESQKLAEGFA